MGRVGNLQLFAPYSQIERTHTHPRLQFCPRSDCGVSEYILELMVLTHRGHTRYFLFQHTLWDELSSGWTHLQIYRHILDCTAHTHTHTHTHTRTHTHITHTHTHTTVNITIMVKLLKTQKHLAWQLIWLWSQKAPVAPISCVNLPRGIIFQVMILSNI